MNFPRHYDKESRPMEPIPNVPARKFRIFRQGTSLRTSTGTINPLPVAVATETLRPH